MSIESSADWDGLGAVSSVVSQTLSLLERAVEPGITTADLDRIAAAFLRSCGARSAPAQVYGFPGTVLISVNEEVVHGIPGRRVVERVVRSQGFSVVKGLAGHGVGRTIHEAPTVPNEWDPRQADFLTEGLVITIEPMVSAGSGRSVEEQDGWTIRTRDRSLAAHYEDTVVITQGEPIVLTRAAA